MVEAAVQETLNRTAAWTSFNDTLSYLNLKNEGI